MDRYQVRVALFKISVVALIFSTWVFWSFLLSTRPQETVPDALAALVRLPASLPAQLQQATLHVPDPIAMDIVRVPCWDKFSGLERETDAHFVRLIGKSCNIVGDLDAITVHNASNGYNATIFSLQTKSMTTDFIPLQEGHNQIVIRYADSDGASVETQVGFLRK